MYLLNANNYCLQTYTDRFLEASLFGTTKIAVDSIFITVRTLGDFSKVTCFQNNNYSKFPLRMSTANVAWLLLGRIVQIIVYGKLTPLEGTLEPGINKKV
jgi:hypothetical protein